MTYMIGAKEMQRTFNRPFYSFSFLFCPSFSFAPLFDFGLLFSFAQGEKEYRCYGYDREANPAIFHYV